jgi:prepilin-type N-terminal cleavage/methylation domain-containing protein
MKISKKGFTLIELLVVVLIIGILSAVALPQYQKAVEKARFTSVVVNVKTWLKAQQVFYLESGRLGDMSEIPLDLDIPDETTATANNAPYGYSPEISSNNWGWMTVKRMSGPYKGVAITVYVGEGGKADPSLGVTCPASSGGTTGWFCQFAKKQLEEISL